MKNTADIGLNPEQLNRLVAALNNDVKAGRYDGGVVLVARHGVIGLEQAVGFADKEKNRKCRLDDVFKLMSITKAFIDVLILRRIESGDISFTTRVAEIIPEFKGVYKEQVTIFHLLTHTAGQPQFEPNLIGEHAMDASIKMGLVSPPGEKLTYSVRWVHTMLAEILRRIERNNRTIRKMLMEELFLPLKMNETDIISRKDMESRLIPLIARGGMDGPPGSFEAMNKIHTDETDFAGWGSISTIHDLFRFAEMLRCGGTLDGARILSPVSVEQATKIQTGTMKHEPFPGFAELGWRPFPANTGLDLAIRGEGLDYPCSLGSLTSPRTFGKFGAGTAGFWVDPERDITFIFLSVGALLEQDNFLRFQKLSDMAISAVM